MLQIMAVKRSPMVNMWTYEEAAAQGVDANYLQNLEARVAQLCQQCSGDQCPIMPQQCVGMSFAHSTFIRVAVCSFCAPHPRVALLLNPAHRILCDLFARRCDLFPAFLIRRPLPFRLDSDVHAGDQCMPLYEYVNQLQATEQMLVGGAQQGYQQQGGYGGQQGGYPQQQGGYPQQQGGYPQPHQQGGYPQQQWGGYPQQGGY